MEFKLVNVKDTSYYDECKAEQALYCELRYRSHASNFAAMVFEYTEENRDIMYDPKYIERIIVSKDKYDNLRIGCDDAYIKYIVDKYNELNPPVGIKIHFLVYSDVGSSQKIFEKLIELILFMIDRKMIWRWNHAAGDLESIISDYLGSQIRVYGG